MNPVTRRVSHALMLLLAVALTVGAYYRGLSGDYIFDDFPNLLHNKQVHVERLDPASLKAAAFSSGSGVLLRPVSMTTFALNHYFFGIKPYSFKAVNLAVHLLNGLALFWLASLLLTAFRRIHRPELPDNMIFWTALAASAVWMLHPINLTGVLFVVQRMASLAALFTVLGLSLYVLGRTRLWEGRPGLGLMLVGVLLFGPLAVFSKESGALLPLYMLVVEFTLFGFRNGDRRFSKPVVVFFFLAVALPVLAGLVWLVVDPQHFFSGYSIRTFTMAERLLTEARVLLFYLKLIFVPTLGDLGLYHDGIGLSSGLLKPISTLLSVIALIALMAGSVLLRKRAPFLSLGVLWFFAGHALESTIFPLEIAFEHRNYLAGFGPMFATAFFLLNVQGVVALRRVYPMALVALVSVLFVLTWLRAGQWSSNVDQALHEARHHPESVRANYGAGRIMAHLVLAGQFNDPEPAFQYFEKARALGAAHIGAECAMIVFAAKIGRAIDPAWIDGIEHKLRHQPITPNAVISLKDLIRCQEGDCDISDTRMRKLIDSAFQNPSITETKSIYADMLFLRGSFLINRLRSFEAGLDSFEAAVQAQPSVLQYRINLTQLLVVMGRTAEARAHLDQLKTMNRFDQYLDKIDALEKELTPASG